LDYNYTGIELRREQLDANFKRLDGKIANSAYRRDKTRKDKLQ
jgi:hypothetical protein